MCVFVSVCAFVCVCVFLRVHVCFAQHGTQNEVLQVSETVAEGEAAFAWNDDRLQV